MSELETLSAGSKRTIPEKIWSRLERATVLGAAIMLLTPQSLDEEPTPNEVVKYQAGVSSLSELNQVMVLDLQACPRGEGVEELPEEVHVNSARTSDGDDWVEIASVVTVYDKDDTTIYCGASIGPIEEFGLGSNAPEATVVVIPGSLNPRVYEGAPHLEMNKQKHRDDARYAEAYPVTTGQ